MKKIENIITSKIKSKQEEGEKSLFERIIGDILSAKSNDDIDAIEFTSEIEEENEKKEELTEEEREKLENLR